MESVSNDEWRGNWKKNVLNNVDRLYLKLVIPASSDAGEQQIEAQCYTEEKQQVEGQCCIRKKQQAGEQRQTAEQSQAGMHQLRVWAIDKYFAFSRMVIYTKPRKENNLAGIRGEQALPKEQGLTAWCEAFYAQGHSGEICQQKLTGVQRGSSLIETYHLLPRPVFYAVCGNDRDSLTVTCREEQAQCFGRMVKPDWYFEQRKHIFAETDGAIRIDAASVLVQSKNAWTQDAEYTRQPEKAGQARGIWRHCSSESYGRSGLAMYIRACQENQSIHFTESIFQTCPVTPELRWTPETAPSLNYRIQCSSGTYTVWMLSKFNVREEGFFDIGIDKKQIPEEKLYGNGSLWRYEAEQIYRWVPTAQILLAEGEHTLHIYALASGMRYDRFFLTKRTEQPPMDAEW